MESDEPTEDEPATEGAGASVAEATSYGSLWHGDGGSVAGLAVGAGLSAALIVWRRLRRTSR